MKVLVTRPLEDASETARQLAARGHQALIAPLLQTIFRDGAALDLEGVQAVLATSANGVRALARRTARRDVALFAVGPQTAQAAEAAGFTMVRNAHGDAKALALAAAGWARPEQGALLHVSGEAVAGTLVQTLRAGGFTVLHQTLYQVVSLPLAPEAALALRQGELDAALFFSPRSAGAFRDCVLQETLPTQRLLAAAISAATAAALAPLDFAALRIAEAPHQDALLDCFD